MRFPVPERKHLPSIIKTILLFLSATTIHKQMQPLPPVFPVIYHNTMLWIKCNVPPPSQVFLYGGVCVYFVPMTSA